MDDEQRAGDHLPRDQSDDRGRLGGRQRGEARPPPRTAHRWRAAGSRSCRGSAAPSGVGRLEAKTKVPSRIRSVGGDDHEPAQRQRGGHPRGEQRQARAAGDDEVAEDAGGRIPGAGLDADQDCGERAEEQAAEEAHADVEVVCARRPGRFRSGWRSAGSRRPRRRCTTGATASTSAQIKVPDLLAQLEDVGAEHLPRRSRRSCPHLLGSLAEHRAGASSREVTSRKRCSRLWRTGSRRMTRTPARDERRR